MCGLVGAAGDLGIRSRAAMKDLLFLDTLRGKDSTGLSRVSRNRVIQMKKMTVPGYEFIEMPWIDDLLATGDQLWMGHNRFKTMGTVSRSNAHPFWVPNEKNESITLIGAHNGTLRNKYEIEKHDALNGDKFGTDSEALLTLIARLGPAEAISEAEGAWSLVWWNAPENTVNFLRNKERPMYYCFSSDEKCLYWASEPWMLYNALGRNNITILAEKGDVGIRSTAEDTLYSFQIPQKITDKFDLPERKGGLLGKPEKATFQLHYGQGGYVGYAANKGDDRQAFWERLDRETEEAEAKRNQSNEPGTKETKKDEKQSVILGNPPSVPRTIAQYTGYKGKPMTSMERNAVAKKGCGWCGTAPIPVLNFAMIDEETAVCHKCVRGWHQPTDVTKQVIAIINKEGK